MISNQLKDDEGQNEHEHMLMSSLLFVCMWVDCDDVGSVTDYSPTCREYKWEWKWKWEWEWKREWNCNWN